VIVEGASAVVCRKNTKGAPKKYKGRNLIFIQMRNLILGARTKPKMKVKLKEEFYRKNITLMNG